MYNVTKEVDGARDPENWFPTTPLIDRESGKQRSPVQPRKVALNHHYSSIMLCSFFSLFISL